MTFNEMSNTIGKYATLSVKVGSGRFALRVEIVDARQRFGRIDVLVDGLGSATGTVWVSLDTLTDIRANHEW